MLHGVLIAKIIGYLFNSGPFGRVVRDGPEFGLFFDIHLKLRVYMPKRPRTSKKYTPAKVMGGGNRAPGI